MSATVSNKHILITGGGSGIGKASALLLGARGALVAVADCQLAQAEDVATQINDAGGRAYALPVDVADPAQVSTMFSAAAERQPIDVVINNAGIDHAPMPMHQVDDAVFLKNVEVNLAGTWYCMKAALAHMLNNGHGQIINVASVAGLRSAPTVSAYSASKHGVIGLTRSAAVEYARMNIRINAVCPSFVDTPMVQGVLAQMDERGKKQIVGANPMKRLGKPEEVAGAVAWLCSDESSFMTGQSVVLDGGMLA
ncbi:SDR family oxidoreductase [Alteromonas sp. ASW11-19]|uniref:SDR family oxidoreductase n=1 Tax=Alteromonas salexigens TaxID=2982530 RepID=A0ABT2VL33_9ALTE|nr:SDR family NAD(P)-dependent oxidoreductase [Alteromonas salexigens]MCU7554017.1 SDR family oxidoreductase [Alteromonas salexigens]